MNAEIPWRWLVAACAALAIVGYYVDGGQLLHWLCKPLTTLLIVAMAWRTPGPAPYRRCIIIGLLLSTMGDVFLMLPGDYFVAGLLSFLLAHIGYLIAFRARTPWFARIGPWLAYGLIGLMVVGTLWSAIPNALRLPVLIYVVALAAMAAMAATVWLTRRDHAGLCAAVGGGLFLLSDSIIAIDRFGFAFEWSKALILVSYWTAQYLIARSIPADGQTAGSAQGGNHE